MNSSQNFDDDSVEFEILTRPSFDASGSYSVSLSIDDYFNNNSLSTGNSFTWIVTPNTSISYQPDVWKFIFSTIFLTYNFLKQIIIF